jgi:hypothetical protein
MRCCLLHCLQLRYIISHTYIAAARTLDTVAPESRVPPTRHDVRLRSYVLRGTLCTVVSIHSDQTIRMLWPEACEAETPSMMCHGCCGSNNIRTLSEARATIGVPEALLSTPRGNWQQPFHFRHDMMKIAGALPTVAPTDNRNHARRHITCTHRKCNEAHPRHFLSSATRAKLKHLTLSSGISLQCG